MSRTWIARSLVVLAVGGLATVAGPGRASAGPPPDPSTSGWTIDFRDEFNDGTDPRTGTEGWFQRGTAEAATLTCVADPDPKVQRNFNYSDDRATSVGGGYLTLSAARMQDCATTPDVWRSGHIATNKKFGGDGGTYLFEARIRFPQSTGNHGGFWLRTGTEEIDLMESWGQKESTWSRLAMTRHTADGATSDPNDTRQATQIRPANADLESWGVPGWANKRQWGDFRTYTALWTPGVSWQFWIDGVAVGTMGSSHAQQPAMPLILSNLVNDGQEVSPNTAEAKNMQVNWVRVWKKNPPPASPPPPPPVSACADNDYWRAQFGVAPYDFQPNSNPAQANQRRFVFDRIFYYFTYADVRTWAQNKVATQGGNLWDHVQWHWLNYGIPQGRTGAATFDPIFYMNTYPDVSAAYGWNNYQGAIDHYVTYGVDEGRLGSSIFDPTFYRSCYGDIAGRTNAAVLDHFTKYGMDEGRQGSASFAPAWYLAAYPDIRAAFGSNNYRGGTIHWISGGRGEGRSGHP